MVRAVAAHGGGSLDPIGLRRKVREPQFLSKEGLDDEPELFPKGDDRFANRAGLTVVWPLPHEDITLVDD